MKCRLECTVMRNCSPREKLQASFIMHCTPRRSLTPRSGQSKGLVALEGSWLLLGASKSRYTHLTRRCPSIPPSVDSNLSNHRRSPRIPRTHIQKGLGTAEEFFGLFSRKNHTVEYLFAFKASIATQGGFKTETTVSTLFASHTCIRCKKETTRNIRHHLRRVQTDHELFDHDEHPEGWSQRLLGGSADVGVLVDIRSDCSEIKTQMDLESAENCPCAFPGCGPVSLSCGDRMFTDDLVVSHL